MEEGVERRKSSRTTKTRTKEYLERMQRNSQFSWRDREYIICIEPLRRIQGTNRQNDQKKYKLLTTSRGTEERKRTSREEMRLST